MIWENWPQGAESIVAPGDSELCPVCASTLRPVEVLYTSKPNDYISESRSIYVAICPKCRTQYLRDKPADEVFISPDAENLTELEERVRTLENTLSKLIAFIRQSQVQSKAIQERPPEAKPDTPEEFTKKYGYLLSVSNSRKS